MDGFEVSSAGTAPDATCQVTADLLEWADAVFVMERRQKRWIEGRFAAVVRGKRLVSLEIPDRYDFMQAELIAELRAKVLPRLRARTRQGDEERQEANFQVEG
jgi:predicted protein tyrosine phosphatase